METLVTVKTPLVFVGRQTINMLAEMGRMALFFFKGLFLIFAFPLQVSKIKQQIFFIGLKSMLIICLTGIFTGMVLGLQGYYTLVAYGSVGTLGQAVALSLIREMGPVLSAIMIVARGGSAMAAEIGIMRISEQIDALETMDIDPIRFLLSPRIAAALISFPLLTALFDVLGIIGGYLTGSLLLGVNPGLYFARVESSVGMSDVMGGFIKSLVFAVVIVTNCCYQGYHTHRRAEFGAKSVSQATTSAVVISCVVILITDYVLTSFLL